MCYFVAIPLFVLYCIFLRYFLLLSFFLIFFSSLLFFHTHTHTHTLHSPALYLVSSLSITLTLRSILWIGLFAVAVVVLLLLLLFHCAPSSLAWARFISFSNVSNRIKVKSILCVAPQYFPSDSRRVCMCVSLFCVQLCSIRWLARNGFIYRRGARVSAHGLNFIQFVFADCDLIGR